MTENASNSESVEVLERLQRDVEAFVQAGEADAAFDAYNDSLEGALADLEKAESLDPAKFRTPITL